MTNNLLTRLAGGEILVADGAMGSMLLASGLAAGDCPESFNLTRTELLSEIARRYLEAGADIVQTNTFGGSPLKLAGYGLDDQTEAINSAAVVAVREAVADRAYVCGSCGPCGHTLLPYGDTEPESVFLSFRRQLAALASAGVDVLCIETMIDLEEAKLAVRAAREVAPDLPIMATMTFDRIPRGYFTIMGTDIPTAAAELARAGADIVGSNCGNGSERMVEIAQEFCASTELPVLIQSNAGLPELVGDRAVYNETPDFLAGSAARILDAGVRIVGGCCGTTPDHIRALRELADRCAERKG